MTATIFANYGVIGHEKEVVYKTAPIEGAVSDKIIVDIPPELSLSHNSYGEAIVKWGDCWFILNGVLESDDDGSPYIAIPSKHYNMRCKLKLVENSKPAAEKADTITVSMPMSLYKKIIRGLEAHANPKSCITCAGEDCPYFNDDGSHTDVTCSSVLAADAVALLKQQREVQAQKGGDDGGTP